MSVQPIPTSSSSLSDAFSMARAESAPVFCPSTIYTDDRGWSLMNQMTGVLSAEGQINYSVQYPGVVKAWHRHAKQTDFWMPIQGNIKIGVHRESDSTSWATVVGEKRPGVVIIPPTLWHGAATVGPTQAGLLYFVTHCYDPASPDEERRAFDSVSGFPWGVEHR